MEKEQCGISRKIIHRSRLVKNCSWCHCWILLLVCVSSVTGQDPRIVSHIVEAGEDTPLVCNVSHADQIIWLFTHRDPGSKAEHIAQGSTVFKQEHYGLEVRNNRTELVLTVKGSGEDDEGIYFCQEQGITTVKFNLTVEIPPLLHLQTLKGERINDTLDAVFKEETPIRCVATGSKPTVSLSWEVNSQAETGTVTVDDSREDERVIVSTLQYIPNLEDRTLACITGGQEAVPSAVVRTEVNVMYEPICNLIVTNETTNEYRLFCSCDANPSPSNYSIYVNGTLHSTGSAAVISSHQAARVYCSAYNSIGGDTTPEQELKPFEVPQPLPNSRVALFVSVGVAVPLIAVIGIGVYLYMKKKKRADQNEQELEKQTNRWKSRALSGKPLPPEEQSVPLRKTEQDLTLPSTASPSPPEEGNSEQSVPLTGQADLTNPKEAPQIDKEEWEKKYGKGDDNDL